jgi:hypothetical protein
MTLIPVMPKPEPIREHPTDGEVVPTAPLYTCPMASHAHVVSDQPGKCPECEMTLVETTKVSHGEAAEEHWRRQRMPGQ